MSTQIEKLADEFVEIIARQVVHELNTRASLNTEYGERLAALEAKTHHFTFKKLDDLQAEIQGLRDCNLANLQVMRSQQEKIDHLETILARIEVTSVTPTMVDHMIQENLSDVDIDYKIERAIEDCDFSESVERAFGDVNFADYGLFTEHDLIEFLNDRVRITVE